MFKHSKLQCCSCYYQENYTSPEVQLRMCQKNVAKKDAARIENTQERTTTVLPEETCMCC